MSQNDDSFRIGMVLYEGYDPMDIVGPHEVFSWLGMIWPERTIQIDIISDSLLSPGTSTGLRVYPTSTFDVYEKNALTVDLIFVPGGTVEGFMQAMQNKRLVRFVQKQAASADYICSVCFGAFILGQAGLLKGKAATTYWSGVNLLSLFPKVTTAPDYPRYCLHTEKRRGRRVHLITGGGISSGIDESLKLVSLIAGDSIAQQVQLGIQYNPKPPFVGGDPTVADPKYWRKDQADFTKKYKRPLKKIIANPPK